MKTSEIARRVGLDVSSIRFYERKGLISPARSSGSNYRDYTEEDVVRLKQIVLFRKMNLSIEEIKSLILEGKDIETALKNQQKTLEQEKEQLEGSLSLCRKFLEDSAFANIDFDYYLSYVEEAESRGQRFPDVFPVLDQIAENAGVERYGGYLFSAWILRHKWVRRMFAVLVFGLFIVFPIVEITQHVYAVVSGNSESYMSLVFWCFYGAFSTSAFLKMVRPSRLQ